MMIRLVICFLIVFCVLGVRPAQAGWLEFFIPALRDKADDPSRTLRAPFAAPSVETEGPQKPKTEQAVIALDQPHRANPEVAEWVMTLVSNALTFESGQYEQQIETLSPYFDTIGKNQYLTFLKEQKLEEAAQSGRYAVRSYVRDAPLLLNEGAVDKRYRWLYEVPVKISYIDRNAKDYTKTDPISRDVMLLVQVGRIGQDPGVLLERWSVRAAKSQSVEQAQ